MNKFNFNKLTPFKWFILENFPFIEVDFDALTEWQLFCKLGKEINKIINSQNTVGNEMEILSQAFINLQNYVNNYFDNLDVQDEINNKLNEMAESGQLTDIISQYLQLAGILAFNNIENLKNATNLTNGSFAYTYGTVNYADGLGNFYKIRNIINTDVIDNVNIVSLTNFPSLVAELIPNRNLRYYKVKLTDTFETIQKYFNDKVAKVIEFETGVYNFNTAFRLTANTKILLNNSNLIFNVPKVTEDWENSHGFYNFKRDDEFLAYNGNGNIEVVGGTITHGNFSFCHAKNITFKNINFELCNNDHVLEMCGIDGLLVENCVFDGQVVNTSNFKECIQIDNVTYGNFPFFDNENNPSYDNTTNKNWIIRNNEFKNPGIEGYTFYNAIGMHGFTDGYYHDNIIVENNLFNNSINLSMQLFNVKNMTIKNNNFYCDNQSAINNEGSHIRVKNAFENLKIENNIFKGNLKAIDVTFPVTNNKSLYINNNTFENYQNNVDNISLITLSAVEMCYIINNIFKDFTMGCIRTNYSEKNSNNKYFILNNSFITNESVAQYGNTLKLYDGFAYVANNYFDINNILDDKGCILLSEDSNEMKIINNKFNDYLIQNNKTISFSSYDNNRKNIENVCNAWEGNEVSLQNARPLQPFSNYKKMIITLGGSSGTYSIPLQSWNTKNQLFLDERTYIIPVANSYVRFTINSDNTFSYDHNGTNIPLRNISLYND